MKKTTTKFYCDVCGKEFAKQAEIKYPIIFHTEQTEGRGVKPYISNETIDLCEDCIEKALVIHAWGAQGNNTYSIRCANDENDECGTL